MTYSRSRYTAERLARNWQRHEEWRRTANAARARFVAPLPMMDDLAPYAARCATLARHFAALDVEPRIAESRFRVAAAEFTPGGIPDPQTLAEIRSAAWKDALA